MVVLVLFLIFVSSLDSIESRYALVLRDALNCMHDSKMQVVLYKNTTSLAKSNIGSIAGYFEFLEAIQPNRNFQVRIETKGIINSTKIHSLNVPRTDLCNYLSTDLSLVPLIRRVFDLEKFCPIAKGKHTIYRDTIVSKYRPYIPLGCWIIVTRITIHQSEPFACVNITVQSLPSLKSELYKCT